MATDTTEQTKHSESKSLLIGPLELTKEALVIYKNNFHNFFPIYLAFGLLSALTDISESLVKSKILSFPLSQISIIVLDLFLLYLTILLILTLKKKVKNVELIDRDTLHKMWPVFLLYLLYGVILLGGFLLLIIPSFIFATWYMFGAYILLTENLGIQDSLAKSKFYVKGHFWGVFRAQISFLLLMMSLYLIMYLIFAVLSNVIFHNSQPPQLLINLVTALVTMPLAGFVSPLGIIYIYRLYNHLKALSPAYTPSEKPAK